MATTWEDYHLDRVYPYTALEKADIAERIWRQAGLRRPDHARQRPHLEGLSKYFIWLQDTLRNWDYNPHVNTYAIVPVLDEIKRTRAFRNRLPNKTELRRGLRSCGSFARIELGRDNQLQKSIELAIRIWLHIWIHDLDWQMFYMQGAEDPLSWPDGKSISDIIQAEIHPTPAELSRSTQGRRFSPLFNLRDIQWLTGFEVVWTDDLSKHLLVDRNRGGKFDVSVSVYHHVGVLDELQNGWTLGPELVDETKRTLALLIPFDNDDCRKWFDLQSQFPDRPRNAFWLWIAHPFHLLARFWREPGNFLLSLGREIYRFSRFRWHEMVTIRVAHEDQMEKVLEKRKRAPQEEAGRQHITASRRVADYNFWKERLVILEDEFNNAEPRTLVYWWRDKRKRKQWYTFFLAVLALTLAALFGSGGVAVAGYSAWAAGKKSASANDTKNKPSTIVVPVVACCNSTVTGSASSLTTLPGIATYTVVVNTTVTTTLSVNITEIFTKTVST